MSFLDAAVIEKVKPTISSITNKFFGSNKKNNSDIINIFEKRNKITETKETKITVNKKVWVNGQEFVVMANSQQDLDSKIKKLNEDRKIVNVGFKETEKILFSGLYTEKKPVQINEWAEKRDVWINEYCPN